MSNHPRVNEVNYQNNISITIVGRKKYVIKRILRVPVHKFYKSLINNIFINNTLISQLFCIFSNIYSRFSCRGNVNHRSGHCVFEFLGC